MLVPTVRPQEPREVARIGSSHQGAENVSTKGAKYGSIWQNKLLAEAGRVRVRYGDKPLSNDAKYKEQSRETAMCVEMALNTVEDDIRSELKTTGGQAADALKRILEKLDERRKVLVKFTAAA